MTFRLGSPSRMSRAPGSDRASRYSLVTTEVSPARQAASASRNPVRWRLVLVRSWSPVDAIITDAEHRHRCRFGLCDAFHTEGVS